MAGGCTATDKPKKLFPAEIWSIDRTHYPSTPAAVFLAIFGFCRLVSTTPAFEMAIQKKVRRLPQRIRDSCSH